MAQLRLIALAALAACGHGPKLTPASQPDVELARARRDFHRGDCTHATVSLRRLSFELGPTQPELAEVHYYLAECFFQTGDKVQAAYDSAIIYFKDVIASYPGTSRVPDALMRLVEIYRAIHYADELKETCTHLRRFYPQAAGLEKTCPADASGGTASAPAPS